MFEEFLGGGIAMIVFAVILRFFFGRGGASGFDSIADAHEDAGDADNAKKLRDTAESYRTRVGRYFCLLLIIGLAMILVSLIGRP